MASSFHFAVANLVLLFGLACSQRSIFYLYCSSNVPSGSPVLANRNNLLAAMIRASQANIGFSAFWSGVSPNTVYGLANCRGDLNIQRYCVPCIRNAVQVIRSRCPNSSNGEVWNDYCIVRYSRSNFFGTFTASQGALIRSRFNFPNPNALFSSLGPLFNIIIRKVASPANNGMVKEQTALPGGVTLYGGALCTGDLRPFVCARCLRAAVRLFDIVCRPSAGCRVFLSSCFARYAIHPFTASLDAGFNNTLPVQAIETSLTRYEFEQEEQVNNTLPGQVIENLTTYEFEQAEQVEFEQAEQVNDTLPGQAIENLTTYEFEQAE